MGDKKIMNIFKKKQCQGWTKSTNARCTKKIRWNLKYCWHHEAKNAIIIALLIGVFTSVIIPKIWEHYFPPSAIKKSEEKIVAQTKELEQNLLRQLSDIEPVLTPFIFGKKLRLTNEGSVEIKKICKQAVIAGYFEINSRKITDHQVVILRPPLLLQESLLPDKSVVLDIFPHLITIPTSTPSDSIVMTLYGLVLTYKRVPDMKLFEKFIPFSVPFEVLKDTTSQNIIFFAPLFPQPGSAEAGKTDFNLYDEARSELIRLYKDKVADIEIK